jgi:hypothetical protein
VTISAPKTLGGAEPRLEVHVNAGLNVGLSEAPRLPRERNLCQAFWKIATANRIG